MPLQTTNIFHDWVHEVHVDLRSITDDTKAELNQLLMDKHVLLFRKQRLDNEQFLNAITSFGEPWTRTRELNNRMDHTAQYDGAHDYVEEVSEVGTAGTFSISFHTDCLHINTQEIPGRCLYCVELDESVEQPPTQFLNSFIDNHPDVDFSFYYRKNAQSAPSYPVSYIPKPMVRPALHLHPYHQRLVFMCNPFFTTRIEGIDNKADSLKIIRETMEQMFRTEGMFYEHHWQKGDLLVYDNNMSSHGRPGEVVGKRRLKRLTWDPLYPGYPTL